MWEAVLLAPPTEIGGATSVDSYKKNSIILSMIETVASKELVAKSVVLSSVIPVAASWRGMGMDAEIEEDELKGAITAGAAVVV